MHEDLLVGLLTETIAAPELPSARDWEETVELAVQHQLAPLLHARLKERGIIPPFETGVKLRESYLGAAARNMRLFHELGEILVAFQAADIPVIPLKGPCLAQLVYADIATRPTADLDLLVKQTSLMPAVNVLRTLGYESERPFDTAVAQVRFQDMPPMSRRGGPPVELHWTLVTPLCNAGLKENELAGLWSRAIPVTISGVQTLMLEPTDLMLHLCMHMSVHHRFSGICLRNFVDVAEVNRRYRDAIDWDAFVTRARAWQVATGVTMALQLAEELGGAGIPASVFADLGPSPVDDMTFRWARSKVLDGSPAVLNSDVARLEARGGVGGRFGAIRDAIFLPRAVMARTYPAPADSWRILAFYPVRLKDLLVRYRRALWKLATRDKGFVADARNEARLRAYLGWR